MTATRPQLQGSCLKWLGSPSGEWETLGEKVPGRAWWRLHVGPCLMFHFCLGGLTATLGGIFYFLNWGVVNFQCCANTRYTTKWFSYAYLYTHILFFNIPLWFLIGYWIWFSVLYNGFLFVTYFIYSSVYMLIPNSFILSPFRFGNRMFVFYVSRSICFVHKFICVCVCVYMCIYTYIPHISDFMIFV